jgi:hypothetical protein
LLLLLALALALALWFPTLGRVSLMVIDEEDDEDVAVATAAEAMISNQNPALLCLLCSFLALSFL